MDENKYQNREESKNILNHREYIIKNDNVEYNLRLEIDYQYIYIILSQLNKSLDYIFKNKMDLLTISNKLELNSSNYSNIESLLNTFDILYNKNKILININEEKSCDLIMKLSNEETIKLYKEKPNDNDKFNNLFNKISELKKYINNKENEMNEKINKQNNIIKELNERLIIKENNINELINNKIKEIENKINNNINYNNMVENINLKFEKNTEKNKSEKEEEINYKIIENNNISLNNINNDINYKLKELKKDLNFKYNELREIVNNLAYINRINYKFKNNPIYLKYKLDITNSNTNCGLNDRFEIFTSYSDNKEYIVSPNIKNYNLDIFELLENKKILSLQGHKNIVRTIRYFINENNYNEYLISADDNKIVIIWDITNNYKIKYQIDTKYGDMIYSCLLVFPKNNEECYIITSSYGQSDDIEKSATKIYSLNNGKFIKYINNSNNNYIYYLLSWHNKKNYNYYIIQFSYQKIIINNLLKDELYSELKQKQNNGHYSGFLYNKDNNDYLCSSSSNGYVNIWDLYNKKMIKIINTNKCFLAHIILWNNKYIIVADYDHLSFKLIDLEENKIIKDFSGLHTQDVYCIKKIYHPIYGESLLSASNDKTIKLWII